MAQERSKGMKANPSFLPNGQPAPANDSGSFSDILQAEVERFAENGDKWPSSNEVLESQPKSTSVAETKAKVDAQLRAAGVLDTPAAAGEGNPGRVPADQPGRSAPAAKPSENAHIAASGKPEQDASKNPVFSPAQPRYAFRDSVSGNNRRPDPIAGPIPETIPDPSPTPRSEPDPLPSFFTRPRSEVSGAPPLSAPMRPPENAIAASSGRFDPLPRSEPLLEDAVTKASVSARRPGIGRGTLVTAIVVSLTAGGLLAIFSGNVAPNFVAAVADRFATASLVPQNGFSGESATENASGPTDTPATATVPAPPVVRYDTLSSSDRVTVVRRSETTQPQAAAPSAGERAVAALTPTTTLNPPPSAAAVAPSLESDTPPSADPPPMVELAFALPKSERIKLLERSQELLNIGDIVSARLFLERLIAAGDPAGAIAMAETFDPKTLERLPVFGMEPDVEQARFWYLKAEEMGATDVQARLQALGN